MCQKMRSSTRAQLGSTLTPPPHDSDAAFRAELRATLGQEAARDIRTNLRRDIRRELTAKLRMVRGKLVTLTVGNRLWKCSFQTVLLRIDMRGPLRRVNTAVRSIVTTPTTLTLIDSVLLVFNCWQNVKWLRGGCKSVKTSWIERCGCRDGSRSQLANSSWCAWEDGRLRDPRPGVMWC